MENTENKFKHDGVWYIAVEVEEDSCRGCDFKDSIMCANIPLCTRGDRQDNRNVVFVRSDVDNLGDEE